MTGSRWTWDLGVLAADREIESVLRAILGRPKSLGIRPIRSDFVIHDGKDPGCRVHPVKPLDSLRISCKHALVVFDREGSGSEAPRDEIEKEVEAALRLRGWGDRARAVVIEPELEAWLWADSPAVRFGLGWTGSYATLRATLTRQGLWERSAPKPHHPKEAREWMQGRTGRRLAAKELGNVAAKVSLTKCQDPAFLKLRDLLQSWFPSKE